jgi:hypothetical protein
MVLVITQMGSTLKNNMRTQKIINFVKLSDYNIYYIKQFGQPVKTSDFEI